jgi:hypothetical protein
MLFLGESSLRDGKSPEVFFAMNTGFRSSRSLYN